MNVSSFGVFTRGDLEGGCARGGVSERLRCVSGHVRRFRMTLSGASGRRRGRLLGSGVGLRRSEHGGCRALSARLGGDGSARVDLASGSSETLVLAGGMSKIRCTIRTTFSDGRGLLIRSRVKTSASGERLSATTLAIRRLLRLSSFGALDSTNCADNSRLRTYGCSKVYACSSPVPSASPGSGSVPLTRFRCVGSKSCCVYPYKRRVAAAKG